MSKKRIFIVGGVAGGASCAARLRRLSEDAEIIVFERGPHVSFANCGLPYYVGDVIQSEANLLLATPELFKARFNIEVRTENEVLSIDKTNKSIQVKDSKTGVVYQEKYDALVLSPGAAPIKPPLPGIDSPGIFTLRNIPDSQKIKQWIQTNTAQEAVIIGAGFIGLEMAENLVHLGLKVTIIEMQPQVLPVIDLEMAAYVQPFLTSKQIALKLNETVTGFDPQPDGTLFVNLKSGEKLHTELVILGIGVKPESGLAVAAGLELGERNSIKVNEFMQTSDTYIWAVGDAVQTIDIITGKGVVIPMAGPANRQGRIAAENIIKQLYTRELPTHCPPRKYRGTQGTAVCGVFQMTIACTGTTEKNLQRLGITDYEKIYLHPGQHVGYYPGASPIHLKLIFSTKDGKILGAQAIGEAGVEKRIDVIATAIQLGGTVFDLEEAELCYAPQFGAAKDPINMAGMIAANSLRGDAPIARWEDIFKPGIVILDVREPMEFAAARLPHSINIPLGQIRKRMHELPKDKEIWCHCGVGQRSYYAVRILRQHGFNAKNLSGGLQMFGLMQPLIKK